MTMTHTIGPYRQFFDITACHPFFADGICRQLQWVPASATWRAMENLGMLFRAIDGGVAVYQRLFVIYAPRNLLNLLY